MRAIWRGLLASLGAAFVILFTAAPTGPIFSNPPRNVGTVSGAQQAKAPFILSKSGIPFISLGSCTMSAGGALSACTALPTAYASAYCYLPANAAATTIAAGWYYCTFSTTQAGTVFLNTYTSGQPTIPASPTAVTTGSSFTGDTTEEFGLTITVPAGAMGANGGLELTTIFSASPNNANAKNPRVRYSGNAGVQVGGGTLTSQLVLVHDAFVTNRGVTNAQIVNSTGITAVFGNSGGTPNGYLSVDTTAATTVVVSLQKATATDNVVLESYAFTLLSDGT